MLTLKVILETNTKNNQTDFLFDWFKLSLDDAIQSYESASLLNPFDKQLLVTLGDVYIYKARRTSNDHQLLIKAANFFERGVSETIKPINTPLLEDIEDVGRFVSALQELKDPKIHPYTKWISLNMTNQFDGCKLDVNCPFE